MPGCVAYTVKRMKEMTTGNYVEASSEENLLCLIQWLLLRVSYPGFVRATDLSFRVTADGKAVKSTSTLTAILIAQSTSQLLVASLLL